MTKTMSVQVKNCQLRNQPSFLGKVLSKLSYADEVTVCEEQSSWVKVQPTKKKEGGWVHISALSEKKIVLNPNSQEIKEAASSDEIALAGKGFNKQVEEKFKEDNKNIDFTWVDKMEKFIIAQGEMQSFLAKADLQPEGGQS